MKPYYQDDFITLYNADCKEQLAWLKADVLVTDPPYGISWMKNNFDSDKSKRDAVQERRKTDGADIIGDENTDARDDVLRMWGNVKAAVVFGTWRKSRPEGVTHRLIWHKKGRFPGVNPHPWYPNDEEIYLVGKGWRGKPTPTVLSTEESRSNYATAIGHPTPKPVGLMELLINKCPEGDIADPFAGSGSTLLAARNAGRKAIGIEINADYCRIAANRISQMVLEQSDKPSDLR